jgi:hypothetical protein
MIDFTAQQVKNLKRGVRGALAFGIVASITANVIASITRPDAAKVAAWQIWAGAALAALAPLVLFISTEMVTRIPVHSRVLGPIRLIITLLLGGFSAWISYWHMVRVAEMLGEHGGAQYIYPLLIDGMMIVATISLIELGRVARTVEVIEQAEAEQAAAAAGKRCQPGCTCGKHQPRRRKPRRGARRSATKAAEAIVSEIDSMMPNAPVSPAAR